MTDAQLRKLKRRELLEILLEQAKEIEQLEKENSSLRHQLEDRQIHVQRAGTMAEAAFALNGVFEAADAAVSQYIENIRTMEAEMRAKTARNEANESAESKADDVEEKPALEAESIKQEGKTSSESESIKQEEKTSSEAESTE